MLLSQDATISRMAMVKYFLIIIAGALNSHERYNGDLRLANGWDKLPY
jgi:hypothetical protein